MEKKILRLVGVQSIIILSIFIFIAVILNHRSNTTVQANTSSNISECDSVESILSDCPNYITIKKSHSVLGILNYTVDALNCRVRIQFETLESVTLDIEDSSIVECERYYHTNKTYAFLSTLSLTFSDFFEVKVCQDAENIYVALYKPDDLYDLVIVVDAGHGGIDTGTLSVEDGITEKIVNLSVSKRVKELLEEQESVKVYMTREDDVFLTPEKRTDFINMIDPDYCISIHCNSGESENASGVEILYQSQDGENNRSKELAKSCLEEIISNTNQVDRGLLEGNNIYIVRNANVPIALVEIGFLSNWNELNYLVDECNQELIAEGIVNAINKMKG